MRRLLSWVDVFRLELADLEFSEPILGSAQMKSARATLQGLDWQINDRRTSQIAPTQHRDTSLKGGRRMLTVGQEFPGLNLWNLAACYRGTRRFKAGRSTPDDARAGILSAEPNSGQSTNRVDALWFPARRR
jgi:hypothetical protein